jgi:hypothetical protein
MLYRVRNPGSAASQMDFEFHFQHLVQWLQGSHLTLPNLIFSFVNKANLPE